jgi:plastocyanin domain-containing protein
MSVFALGTTPGLLAVGAAASTARGVRTASLLRGVGVVTIALATVTAIGPLTTLLPDWGSTPLPTERTSNVADAGGVQDAQTIVLAEGYGPEQTVVYAGQPVAWTLTPEVVTCAGLIDASELGVGRVDALYEPATVTFTLDEPGTYRFGCTMGMYDGTIVAIEPPD